MNCKCSNKDIKESFKYCPYCGSKFTAAVKRYNVEGHGLSGLDIYALNTKEFRTPKKGEYYLSGTKLMAYMTYSDLTHEYYIAEIVKQEVKK